MATSDGAGTLSSSVNAEMLSIKREKTVVSTLTAGHTKGAEVFAWGGWGDFSWKGSTALEGTAQRKGCRICGKRPVLIQLYQHIYTRARIHRGETKN